MRLRDKLADKEGWWTRHFPSGEEMTIYDVSVRIRRRACRSFCARAGSFTRCSGSESPRTRTCVPACPARRFPNFGKRDIPKLADEVDRPEEVRR